jgi:hypothetical protein
MGFSRYSAIVSAARRSRIEQKTTGAECVVNSREHSFRLNLVMQRVEDEGHIEQHRYGQACHICQFGARIRRACAGGFRARPRNRMLVEIVPNKGR